MIGDKIYRFDKLDSTNDYASKVAYEFPEGTVIIAEEQTKGKGTQGKNWFSPKGGVWLSLILKPGDNSCISLMAGVAVCQSLYNLKIPARIKWPNDVFVGRKKIAGVLTEVLSKGEVIIGIGINLNIKTFPAELKDVATSAMIEKNKEYDKNKFVEFLIKNLEEKYILFKKDKKTLLEEWKDYSNIMQRFIEIKSAGSLIRGRVINLDSNGALLLELPSGKIESIIAGEFSIQGE